jgi:hypothetical protein
MDRRKGKDKRERQKGKTKGKDKRERQKGKTKGKERIVILTVTRLLGR